MFNRLIIDLSEDGTRRRVRNTRMMKIRICGWPANHDIARNRADAGSE
jgi:hypothetical protein